MCLVLPIVSEVLAYLLSEEESGVLFSIILVSCASTVFQELLRDRRWKERGLICLQRIRPWSLSNHQWCPRLRMRSSYCLPGLASRPSTSRLIWIRIQGFVYQLATFLSHEASKDLVIALCSRNRKWISCDHQHFQVRKLSWAVEQALFQFYTIET